MYRFLDFKGITVDLSTLRAEWESRSEATSGRGSASGPLSNSFGQLGLNNEGNSISVSGNDANEEIDVVGGLDSCSESGSERVDSAADGSVDGECYPTLGGNANEAGELRKNSQNSSIEHLNHQPGIHHWGLSLLERRRELVGVGTNRQSVGNGARTLIRQAACEDEVQSGSIDLSVKGREERKRLNPFSIDSLLGNNNRTSATSDRRPVTPTSPTSPISSACTSPSTT